MIQSSSSFLQSLYLIFIILRSFISFQHLVFYLQCCFLCLYLLNFFHLSALLSNCISFIQSFSTCVVFQSSFLSYHPACSINSVCGLLNLFLQSVLSSLSRLSLSSFCNPVSAVPDRVTKPPRREATALSRPVRELRLLRDVQEEENETHQASILLSCCCNMVARKDSVPEQHNLPTDVRVEIVPIAAYSTHKVSLTIPRRTEFRKLVMNFQTAGSYLRYITTPYKMLHLVCVSQKFTYLGT